METSDLECQARGSDQTNTTILCIANSSIQSCISWHILLLERLKSSPTPTLDLITNPKTCLPSSIHLGGILLKIESHMLGPTCIIWAEMLHFMTQLKVLYMRIKRHFTFSPSSNCWSTSSLRNMVPSCRRRRWQLTIKCKLLALHSWTMICKNALLLWLGKQEAASD